MAWKKYTPPVSNTKALAPVSLTIPEKGSQARPFLSIDKATLAALGWKPDTSLQLLIGEGEHAGKIRVEPLAGEPTKVRPPGTPKAKRSRLPLGRMPCLTDEAFKSAVPFVVEKTALIVTLPDDARAHELPPGTARAVAQASSPFVRK